mmetsp:Transcript_11013/g.26958  ORF Transcript_11013/g.26958 Transcript_11013/m.26958 type:complete len:86 (+) Transcript_11013:416-673(+)|eukprot:CAMPEP_0178996532 /NCGR_PEP_ID=MMETSP0795-20121207/8416_1 /TAXON_ID=88552 /ORGANISM="Amoebophrya sp., Strain Ameob2" /LENGTH=85 /DNA_ID=CAMNT_0020688923 /DNA_START=285 /DNA_END=542 /DNA_ORIENTATION=-
MAVEDVSSQPSHGEPVVELSPGGGDAGRGVAPRDVDKDVEGQETRAGGMLTNAAAARNSKAGSLLLGQVVSISIFLTTGVYIAVV